MVQRTGRLGGSIRRLAFFGLLGLTPLTMGGCPDLQNSVVDALNTAARTILNAALDAYFEQYRTN